MILMVWSASTAQYEAHFGNPEEARALLREGVSTGMERVGWDTLRLVALSFTIDAAARLDEPAAAELAHELMTPWQDQFVWSGALGSSRRRRASTSSRA